MSSGVCKASTILQHAFTGFHILCRRIMQHLRQAVCLRRQAVWRRLNLVKCASVAIGSCQANSTMLGVTSNLMQARIHACNGEARRCVQL